MSIVPSTTPDDCFELAEKISRSALMPAAYKGKPVDAAVAMMYGAEMGLPPMTSLQRVTVINGKPTLDAQGMTALIRAHGHSITGDATDTQARVTGKRADNGDEMTVTFTMKDAQNAGLAGSSTYKKFPKSMLWARALTQLSRQLFADVLMGASYTPEEMQAVVDAERPPRQFVDSDTGEVTEAPRGPRRPPTVAEEEPEEIVEAEVVEEPQRNLVAELVALFDALEITDKKERLEYVQVTLGRPDLKGVGDTSDEEKEVIIAALTKAVNIVDEPPYEAEIVDDDGRPFE